MLAHFKELGAAMSTVFTISMGAITRACSLWADIDKTRREGKTEKEKSDAEVRPILTRN